MTAIETGAKAPASPWRDEIRATLALSWPMILTNLGQVAMNATDVLLMGRIGPETLAAGALGSNLYFAPYIFGLGLVLATSPMMATELGRRRHSVRDVRRTVRQGLWVAVFACIPIWLFLWNAEHVLLAMGQEPALAADAAHYLRWLQWAALPFYGYIVLRSFISALERPGWALVVVFAAVALNALLAWALMFGRLGLPDMGIAGAGLATSLASFGMFLGMALVVSLERTFRRYHLFGRFWRPDWPRFLALIKLGLPIGGILLFEVSVFNVAALLMGLISAASLAAHSIAMQIASITFMVPLGVNQAVTVRVGLALGARDPDGIRRAGWTALVIGVGFMALMALTMISIPELLIAAFVDLGRPENAEVVVLAVTFLAFAALFQIADGAQAVGAGMLRGLHDTRMPMVYAALGYWGVGLPLGVLLAFPLGLKGSGIWIGLSIGLVVVAILLMRRWLIRERLGLTKESRAFD
ncbi:MATE family efflux transporter [Pseudaminobacter sp. 19-2017]|uniref:Multidrug-efflux transporter n=1 Tax=Pseudaminobacter soli (ex Zhang et al. 2022) TaxID=2831468 RepID=A0A942IAB3_9HYPH|nr:MATE family efflux transporter [Pseudaminobacter soli]MBS3651170.1 MATE family efflux transporter [Pseudaminobacter soli]